MHCHAPGSLPGQDRFPSSPLHVHGKVMLVGILHRQLCCNSGSMLCIIVFARHEQTWKYEVRVLVVHVVCSGVDAKWHTGDCLPRHIQPEACPAGHQVLLCTGEIVNLVLPLSGRPEAAQQPRDHAKKCPFDCSFVVVHALHVSDR